MNPATLVRMQVELEYGFNGRGLLVPFPGSTERARFIIYRYVGGCARYFRHDVPTSIKEEVEALPSEEAVSNPETVWRILGDQGDAFVGRAYVFPAPPAVDEFSDIVRRADRFTIENGGEPVSWAWSVRENETSAEVAVETLPGFRRRGFARQTTRAWASEVMKKGKVAFFSHADDNHASRRLAGALNLVGFAAIAAY